MDVLFLAFSNSREQPLQTLTDEYHAINKILTPRKERQDFQAELLMHASLEDIAHYLTYARERLILFQYSGHAERDFLLTEDGGSRIEGIAQLLAQCPRLQVVILNGCSTYGQVKVLHELGIPLVIATSAPISDPIATIFSRQLYRSLEVGYTIRGAVEMAIGVIHAKMTTTMYRSLKELDLIDANQPLWGIFLNLDYESVNEWRLPLYTSRGTNNIGYQPNEILLEVLYRTFAATSVQVKKLFDAGASLETRRGDIVEAILKAIPAPISEQIRKLVMQTLPEEDGWDKISMMRLSQTIQAYNLTMDFLVFTILAQLWELQLNSDWEPDVQLRGSINKFLDLNLEERRDYDYFTFLKLLVTAFPKKSPPLFIEEVTQFRTNFFESQEIEDACFFLCSLRRQLSIISHQEIETLCERAELALANVYSQLGYLGRYMLATIRNIHIEKYRHKTKANFEHMIMQWHGIQGNYNRDFLRREYFMDNRCVVLFRVGEGAGNKVFLNLSPFILDENTFDENPDLSLSNLYFFACQDGNTLLYKWVNHPEHPEQGIIDLDHFSFYNKREKRTKFQPAKDQFEAFLAQVVDNKKNAES
jgi:hypothetical protein